MTAETLKAKHRACTDLSVVLKTLATDDILMSCGYDRSRPLAALHVPVLLLLALLKLGGFDSTMAKRIRRAGVIRRLIIYLADFRFLASSRSHMYQHVHQLHRI